MISDNPSMVAKADAVVAFFDFVQNPESFRAIIKELREANDERKKIIGLYTTVEEFNRYTEGVQIKYNQDVEALRAEKELIRKSSDAAKLALESREAAAAERDRRASVLSRETLARVGELETRSVVVAGAEQALVQATRELADREAALVIREGENEELRRKLDAALKVV